jgi:alkylation response protein AidB-like acyl-CoA dehydrogenase
MSPSSRQFRASSALIGPDSSELSRRRFASNMRKTAQPCGARAIYDIFEGTAEIQQLVIARAITGMHIK